MPERITSGAAFLFAVTFIVGCSTDSPFSVVRGTVSLDGQLLPEGLIHFVTVDGASPTVEARVTAGKFEAAMPPGEKRVEIRAPKVIGKQRMYETADSPMVDVVTELLPSRYNSQSELRLTVGEGEQEENFELKSK